MSDRETFKELVRKPRRVVGAKADPLVPGTSLFDEDLRMIVGELRARHAVTLESPVGLAEDSKKKAGKASAAARAGRSPADPISESEDEEEGLPEDSQVSTSRTRKLRLRLAKLAAQVASMEAQDAKQNGTKRNTIRENQHSSRSKGAQGSPRK
jgi:hypothetical protein